MASTSFQARDLRSQTVFPKSSLDLSSSSAITRSKFAPPKTTSLKSSVQLSSTLLSSASGGSKFAVTKKNTVNLSNTTVKKDALKSNVSLASSALSAAKKPSLSTQASILQSRGAITTGLTGGKTLVSKSPTNNLLPSMTKISTTTKTQLSGTLQSNLSHSSNMTGVRSSTLNTGLSGLGTANTKLDLGLGGTTTSTRGVGLTSTFQSSVSSSNALLNSTSTNLTLTSGIKTTTSTITTARQTNTTSLTQRVSPLSLKPATSPLMGGAKSTLTKTITVKPQKPIASIPLAKSSLLQSNASKLFQSSKGVADKTKMAQTLMKPKQESYLKQSLVVPTKEEGLPEYEFSVGSNRVEREMQFVPPELDISVQQEAKAPVDTARLKITLINAVATSLLKSPDFKNKKDPSTKHLTKLGNQVSHHDPEFILKLAIYTRNELNIRTTANFLLALAANISYCRPFLKKYFNATINIPSDWIEVAEVYQAFHDKSLNFGSLPTALRKVMIVKFKSFDSYQLAKYNKDTSKKKKKKKPKPEKGGKTPGKGGKTETRSSKYQSQKYQPPKPQPVQPPPPPKPQESSDSDSNDSDDTLVASDTESEGEVERLTFTLKQLIRKLHIADPVEHVMCLIGKRYPEDPEALRRSGLAGIWDQDRAGKRMKLPTPETWETQISMRGNKAEVWEELIDHKKLPFMAMLRNLRNVIIAGISNKHHQFITGRLTDERAVVNSRQFPFRFFSAYEVLNQLENRETVKPMMRGVMKGSNPLKKIKKVKEIPPVNPELLKKYRNALDTALKIATRHNVKPIKGNTVVLCNVGSSMDKPCTSARGLGKPRTVLEIGLLLGLMCKYACEECTVALYGNKTYRIASIEEGTILHNMASLLTLVNTEGLTTDEGSVPPEFLKSLVIDRVVVDNLIVLTDQMSMDTREGRGLVNFLNKYRNTVNPNLLFVSIDLSARFAGVSSTITPQHENDIHLAGYSDQMLRFIAERGDSGQLTHVENIDKKYNLKEVKTIALKESAESSKPNANVGIDALVPSAPLKQWRTVRVFISSTFRDMHGERDLLTRYVFPELRRRCRSLFINIFEVDLRWGITEQDTRSHKALEICLSEISRCNYFIGLLGNRYGWVPDEYQVPDSNDYDWVKEYPSGRSITELEIYHAALCEPDKAVGKSFFYLREQSAIDDVPREFQKDFKSDSHADDQKLLALKTKILTSGLETYNGYRGRWMDDVQGKPMLHKLDDFGQRVLYNLWNAIQKDYPVTNEIQDPLQQASKMNQAFFETQINNFIGRQSLLSIACEKIDNMESGVVLATGKSGSGKSAFMAALAEHIMQMNEYHVITHFIGATPGSTDISNILSRICHEVNKMFSLSEQLPEDYLELVKQWPDFLGKALDTMNNETDKVIVLIDGIDLLDDKHNSRSMDWLPESLPPGAIVVISAVDGGLCHPVLRRHEISPVEITVGVLDISDKAKIVRKKLAAHRKALDESPFNNQMKILMSKREAGNPLYLHLACEELRMFGVFEEVTGFLKKMPATIAMLLQEVLNRLEMEQGIELLSSALAILCIVRNGLKEDEMAEILSLLFSNRPHEGRIPPIVISQLIRSLQTFLQPLGQDHTDMLILAHKEVEKVVRLRYLRGAQAEKERKLHKIISQYFMDSADPDSDHTFKGNDLRAFSELPFHLMSASEWKILEDTVCNVNFVLSKCQLGMATQLLEDYSPSLLNISSASKAKEISRFTQLPKIKEFKSFVARNLHVLLATPTLALQQAINEPKSSLVAREAKKIIEDSPYPLMYWVNKNETEDPCKMTLPHHGDPIYTVSVSPDGSKIAVGFKSCIVRLYQTSTGKEIHSYIGHAGSITGLCFVGEHGLCTSSSDCTMSLWSIKDGYRIGVMKGHTRTVTACTANKSGKLIVSVSLDMSIRVWNGSDGKFVSVLKTPGNASQINCVAFHPEGQLVAVGCWDSTVKVWDTYNKKRLKVLKGHKTSVQACIYISTTHIVSASMDGEVRIWSTRSGITVGVINGHSAPITSINSTPSGQHLITASNDKLVKVWAGSLGTPLHNLGVQTNHGIGHCLFFERTKQTVTVGYHDGFVSKFNIQTGAQTFSTKVHQASIVSVQVINDIHITSSHDRNLKAWTPSSLPSHVLLEGHRAPITAAAWSNNVFASASDDLQILLWPSDIQKYEKSLRRTKQQPTVIQPIHTLTGGHTGQISSIAFSNDGMTMVTGSHDKSFVVWDILSKKSIKTIPSAHNDWINTCAFSNTNPEMLITGSNDFNLKTWNTSDWTQKGILKGHTSAVTNVCSIDGFIISGSVDGSVKVWTRKGIEITTLYTHKQRVNAVLMDTPSTPKSDQAWSDRMDEEESEDVINKMYRQLEDALVISTSDDGSVGVWKPFVPQEITTLKGHSDRVLSVSSSFRNEVVSASLDGSVRVWRPELPDPSAVLAVSSTIGHVGPITSTALCMHSSGVLFGVTSGRDGCFVIWKIMLECDNLADDCSQVKQVYRVRASDSPISSVKLTAKTGVVIGNDAGDVEIWSYTGETYPKCEKRITATQLAGAAPVSKLALTDDNKYLIASSLNNQVLAISGGNKKVYAKMDAHKDWVMGTCSCGTGKQSCVYSIGLDQILIEWNISEIGPSKKGGPPPTHQGTKYTIPLSIPGRRQDPWPLAITSIGNRYLVISDNTGRLFVWEQASKLFILIKKVHKGAINGLCTIDNKIITGSEDGALKIWELKKTVVDVQLKQVGHFYCQSSITSVSAIDSSGGHVTLLVGDCNGYVTVLKWE